MKARKGVRLPESQQKADAARRAAEAALIASTTPTAAEAEMIAAYREALALAVSAALQTAAIQAAEFNPAKEAVRPAILDVRQTNHMQLEATAALRRANAAFRNAVTVAVGHQPPADLAEPDLIVRLLDAIWPFQHFYNLTRQTAHDDEMLLETEGPRGGRCEITYATLRALNAAADAIKCPMRTTKVAA